MPELTNLRASHAAQESGGQRKPGKRFSLSAINIPLLIVIVFVGIVALVVLFPISVMVSGWIVKPISRAWSSQKEFFANASHELKTPLTVISANIDVITSEPEKTVEEQDKWFEYIKSETVKMSKNINQQNKLTLRSFTGVWI